MNVLLVLLVGNILYVGFVTIAQKRLDMMLGYSSVMHMGYIFLGISSLNIIGLSGAGDDDVRARAVDCRAVRGGGRSPRAHRHDAHG